MRNWVYLTAALLALQAVPAHAERDPVSGAPIKPDEHRMTPSPITDRFAVEGIFFNPAVTTRLRVDTRSPGDGIPGIMGTPLIGERDFGLDSRIPQGRLLVWQGGGAGPNPWRATWEITWLTTWGSVTCKRDGRRRAWPRWPTSARIFLIH